MHTNQQLRGIPEVSEDRRSSTVHEQSLGHPPTTRRNVAAVPKRAKSETIGECLNTTSQSFAQRRLSPQQMMILLCKAVSFVANVLQQSQGIGVFAEPNRLGFAGEKDLFVPLRQR